jgi:hypothetical protein
MRDLNRVRIAVDFVPEDPDVAGCLIAAESFDRA